MSTNCFSALKLGKLVCAAGFGLCQAASVCLVAEEPFVPIPPADELLQVSKEKRAGDSPESFGDSADSSVSTEPDYPPGKSGSTGKPTPEKEFDWYFKIRRDQPNLFLNLNGYAWHLNKGDESEEKVNDWPFGLGLTYELRRRKNYIWTVDGDIFFVDSNDDFAAALGSTALWRTKIVDLGVRGGLLYKQNFVDDYGVPLGPVLFPVLQRDFGYFSLKVVYIPPVRKATDEQFFFQVLIPLGGPVSAY